MTYYFAFSITTTLNLFWFFYLTLSILIFFCLVLNSYYRSIYSNLQNKKGVRSEILLWLFFLLFMLKLRYLVLTHPILTCYMVPTINSNTSNKASYFDVRVQPYSLITKWVQASKPKTSKIELASILSPSTLIIWALNGYK